MMFFAMAEENKSLFGSDTVIWRVNRENLLLMGGPAAAILQIAHPQVALGVAAHSNFREDTLGRLRRTLEAVYTITFSPRSEVEAMAAHVRAIHAKVRGEAPQRYSAFSPDAQLWVLATLIELSVQLYEEYVMPLTAEEKEIYFHEMKGFGKWFGLPEDYGPQTWEDFRSYWDDMVNGNELASLPVSRELCRQIAYPDRPLWIRPGWILSGLLAREYVPSPIRERLGLTAPSPLSIRLLRAGVKGLTLLLPPVARYVPHYRRARRTEAIAAHSSSKD
jgi:uncharacterized protein (DUF2236 family)